MLGPMASSMRTKLGESLPSIKRFDVPVEQATTPSLPALKAYALGIGERRKGHEIESIAFFNRAIELDPEFAAAYTTLSTVYGSIGEWRRSEEYAQLAYDRQKRVSERERLFITYQYHDRVTGNQDEAARTLELWKTAYPRDSRPPNALALIYNRFGRYDEAVAEATEALRRSPGTGFPMSNLAFAYRGLGRYADARRVGDEAVKLERGHGADAPAALPARDHDERRLGGGADRVVEVACRASSTSISAQAQVASFEGRLRDAATLYGRAADLATARSLSGTASGLLGAPRDDGSASTSDPRRATERVRDDCGAHGQRRREPRDDPEVPGRRRARPRRARNRRAGAGRARPPAVS